MIYNLGDKSILFKYISINLKNVYLSTIQVSDEYTLDLAKNIYNYLKLYYPKLSISNLSGVSVLDVKDISEYFLYGNNKEDTDSSDLGATIKAKFVEHDEENIQIESEVYDNNSKIYPESISDINKYNIINWPINDSVIQYLLPGVVISNMSSIDDVANAQYSLTELGYKIKNGENSTYSIGEIDNDFCFYCYCIQKSEHDKNNDIVYTGYYDIFVESYVRSLGEVRS